jgi:superfamily II DNA or RNA helicase
MLSEAIKNLKYKYKNGYDNIGRDLFGVCLKEAKIYRRGTGFFSGSALMAWAEAMDHIIKDNVKIQIICSPVVNDRTLLEILKKNSNPQERKQTIQKLSDGIVLTAIGYKISPDRIDYRSKLLAYLIAKGQIEFRFAIPKNYDWPEEGVVNDRNLYHVKVGYFIFGDDSKVAFEGSVNESDSAHQYNTESTQVFRSWIDSDKERLNGVISDLNNDWERLNPHIEVFDLSKETLEIIRQASPTVRPRSKNSPAISTNKFEDTKNNGLRWYQNEALEAWGKSGCKGILEMATGTGKTKTAINAIKVFKNKFPSGVVLVTVPYQNLAEQWVKELNKSSIETIKVYETHESWAERLNNLLLESQYRKNLLPTLVVVEKTFNSVRFQDAISLLKTSEEKNHLIVVDECHHFNREDILELLPDLFLYRLGLSATPYDQFAKPYLDKYFGGIVYKFDLRDAIKNDFLTKYSYDFFPVYLNEEETISYNDLTRQIIRIAGGDDVFSTSTLKAVEALLRNRSKLVAGCAQKMDVLKNHLTGLPPVPYTLFYCGTASALSDDEDGQPLRQIEALTRLLSELGWSTSRITSEENLITREKIIKMFQNRDIEALLSIKVLDEGIDIPACRKAYLLASQASDRQGIQRRGRILRKSEGKDMAILYDFVVVGGQESSKAITNLCKKELRRAYTFSKDSVNFEETKKIIELICSNNGLNLGDLDE